jgi:hypothetical protein
VSLYFTSDCSGTPNVYATAAFNACLSCANHQGRFFAAQALWQGKGYENTPQILY